MSHFSILLRKDFTELIRTKRIVILAFLFLLTALGSPILAYMLPDIMANVANTEGVQITMPAPTIIDSYTQFISNISQLGIFGLIILFGGLTVSERTKGQYTTLRNNGVKNSSFILAKTISQILLASVIYLVCVLLFNLYNWVLFGYFIVEHSILSLFGIYLYLLFIICLMNFFGAIVKSSMISIVLGIGAVLLLGLLNILPFGKYLPSYLMTIAHQVFLDTSYVAAFYQNIGITLSLSVMFVLLAIRFCKYSEK